MIIEKTVKVKWSPRNKSYYVGKGYAYTSMRDGFDVVLEDLSCGANIDVQVRCDSCGDVRKARHRSLKRTGHHNCLKCCLAKAGKYNDLTGKRFARLVVAGRNGRSKQYKAEWVCICDCGKEIVVVGSALISGNTKSCGCLWVDRFTGENNHRYNPNLTDEERQDRRLDENYREWAKGVKEQSEYKCFCCGSSESDMLRSHHIMSWDKYRELRYEMDNGVCLCVACHEDFHKQFGYGSNNINQFLEFIAEQAEPTEGMSKLASVFASCIEPIPTASAA